MKSNVKIKIIFACQTLSTLTVGERFLGSVFLKLSFCFDSNSKGFLQFLSDFFPSNSHNCSLSSFSLINSEIKAKTVPLSVTHKKRQN